MLNLENINTDVISPSRSHLSKINFKVGDNVSWVSTRLGKELFGKIVKLNPKYAQVILNDGCLWTVAYSMLFPVLDGSVSNVKEVFIEHSSIEN